MRDCELFVFHCSRDVKIINQGRSDKHVMRKDTPVNECSVYKLSQTVNWRDAQITIGISVISVISPALHTMGKMQHPSSGLRTFQSVTPDRCYSHGVIQVNTSTRILSEIGLCSGSAIFSLNTYVQSALTVDWLLHTNQCIIKSSAYFTVHIIVTRLVLSVYCRYTAEATCCSVLQVLFHKYWCTQSRIYV